MKRIVRLIPLIIVIALCFGITVFPVSAVTGKDDDTIIVVSQNEITLSVGETKTIEATVVPQKENPELLWYSSNGPVVSVDNKGSITGIKKGEATILIRLRGQEEVYTTVEVSVEEDSETPVDKNDNSDKSKPSTETQDNPAQHVTLRDFSVEEKNEVIFDFD